MNTDTQPTTTTTTQLDVARNIARAKITLREAEDRLQAHGYNLELEVRPNGDIAANVTVVTYEYEPFDFTGEDACTARRLFEQLGLDLPPEVAALAQACDHQRARTKMAQKEWERQLKFIDDIIFGRAPAPVGAPR